MLKLTAKASVMISCYRWISWHIHHSPSYFCRTGATALSGKWTTVHVPSKNCATVVILTDLGECCSVMDQLKPTNPDPVYRARTEIY